MVAIIMNKLTKRSIFYALDVVVIIVVILFCIDDPRLIPTLSIIALVYFVLWLINNGKIDGEKPKEADLIPRETVRVVKCEGVEKHVI